MPHLDPAGRRAWEPSPATQKAAQHLKIEQRREAVEELQLQGFSTRAIARALGVSHTLVQRDLAIIQQQRLLGNIASLNDRLQTSLARRYRVLSQMMELSSNHKVLPKDRIAAAEQMAKFQEGIDLLEGTVAPEKVNTQALAELYSVFSRIVAQANPDQQLLYQQLLREELAGSPVGAALLGSADNYNYAAAVVDQDEESDEEDGENELEDEEIESVEADPEPAPAAQDQQQEEQEIAGDDSEE